MRKVYELLASRPSKPQYTVSSDTPVTEALRQLTFNNLAALVVMSGHTPVGIMSPKGLLLRLASNLGTFEGLCVRDVMSPDIAYATPDTDLLECMVMMTGYVNGAIPVLQQGKLVGVIEMREVTHEVLREQQNGHKPKRAPTPAPLRDFMPLRRPNSRPSLELVGRH